MWHVENYSKLTNGIDFFPYTPTVTLQSIALNHFFGWSVLKTFELERFGGIIYPSSHFISEEIKGFSFTCNMLRW